MIYMVSLACSIIITILVVRRKRGSRRHDINNGIYENPIPTVPKQSKAMSKPVSLSSNIGYSRTTVTGTYNEGKEQAHVDYEYIS